MTSQDLKLDHFKFYDVANQQAGQIIALQGQFDQEREQARLTYLNLFANPVIKNGEALYDKNAHLTWYDLFDPTPDPTRHVKYENQFGHAACYIGRSYALLTPTEKYEKGSAFPKGLDHYKVYQVLQGEPLNTGAKLKDQFGEDEPRIYFPKFFAVPVKKWAQGEVFGINNDSTHLVLYNIYPKTVQKTIKTGDQFGNRYLHVFRSVLLGVPSLKVNWSEV